MLEKIRNHLALTFGLVALVGSFAVLGATVLRVQNLRTTLERPRAGFCYPTQCRGTADCGNTEQCGGCSFCQGASGGATQVNCPSGKIDTSVNPPKCLDSSSGTTGGGGNGGSSGTTTTGSNWAISDQYDKTKRWPACAPGGKEPDCCKRIASGAGFDTCSWPERGWCSPDQCSRGNTSDYSQNGCARCADGNAGCGDNQCRAHCRGTKGCDRGGVHYADGEDMGCVQNNSRCNCGLYTVNGDYCDQTPFQTGKAFAGSVAGSDVSLTPTLNWALPVKPESGGYVNAYMWSCSSLTEDCMAFASVPYPPGDSTSVDAFYKSDGKGENFAADWGGQGVSYHVKNLKPNKTYWWKVTPGGSGGVQYYADLWTFTTGTGALACNPGTTLCGGTCVDLQSNTSNCGACGVSCSSTQVCSEGKCVATSTIPTTHLGCVNGACASVNGAGNNTDGCTTFGGSCSSSICTSDSQCADTKKCTSGQCVDISCATADICKTATVSNHTCSITNKTDSTACTTTTITDGTCQTGVCVAKTNESNTCWGNMGANGRCYDCNGDGVINVLDYSCFRNRYGTVISTSENTSTTCTPPWSTRYVGSTKVADVCSASQGTGKWCALGGSLITPIYGLNSDGVVNVADGVGVCVSSSVCYVCRNGTTDSSANDLSKCKGQPCNP